MLPKKLMASPVELWSRRQTSPLHEITNYHPDLGIEIALHNPLEIIRLIKQKRL